MILISLFPSLALWTVPVRANPAGGIVVHGNVEIGSGAGGNLLINQSSANAIIDWSSFSINAGELTQFIQPSSDSAVLNRVTGGDLSAIHGALQANGNVFLINPNGILVGAGGTIDVHGLVLSTLDVSNGEFLAGGDQVFKGSSSEGVTNLGRINAIGGDVFLIGKTVTNSGSITALNGTVGLGAGEEVLVTTRGGLNGERMFVRAGGAGVSGTGILNDGTIEGAAVELKAHGNAYALAINNKGAIRATGTSTSGGRVYLHGIGGTVSNSGSIRATSSGIGSGGQALIAAAYARVDGTVEASGHSGGTVKIQGTEKVELEGSINVKGLESKGGDVVIEAKDLTLGSTTDIDASGLFGGGTVQIGGGFQGRNEAIENADILLVESGAKITADAVESGNGGVVILWSDGDTFFSGDVSARAEGATGNGGFVEISGKENLGFDGVADATAFNGASGTILLDPTNVTISSQTASASIVNNIALSNLLDLGNNVVITSNFGAAGPAGNITVGRTNNQTTANGDRVEWYQESAGTTPGTLSLLAVGDITFNTSVRSAGTGGINVVAGWDGFTGIVDPLGAGAQSVVGGFDMAAVLSTMVGGTNEAAIDAAGLNGGSVFINTVSGQTAVEVGSRFGDTNVAAHDLILKGSNLAAERFAQLGFNDTGVEYQIGNTNNGLRNEWWGSDAAADGSGFTQSGNIQNKNYIALLGGTRASGGSFDGAGSGADGDITARVSGKVDLRTGDDDRSFVQIGHGGNTQNGMEQERTTTITSFMTRDGYTIDSGDTGRMFFSSSWRTNIEANPFNASDVANTRDYSVKGNITVHAGEDVLVMAADSFESDPVAAALNAANNDASTGMTAQIGHGGLENHGSFHGNVSVTANGVNDSPDAARPAGIGIDVIGGRGTSRFAQIGNGSSAEGNRQSILDQTRSGEITVSVASGAIRLQAYNEPVTGAETAWLYSQVQIGHGGSYQSAPASVAGFFNLAGDIPVEGTPDNSSSGNIKVFAGGTYQDARYADPLDPFSKIGISAQGGTGQYDYAQIGHGGSNQRAATNAGFHGNIDVQAPQGDIVFAGGQDARVASDSGYGRNHALIGHGGRDVDGVKGGTITVLAGQGAGATDGDILFSAGKHLESFAQIGHGGALSSGRVDSLANAAEIVVTARGDIRFESGQSGETNALENSVGYANYWFNYVSGTERNGYWLANDRYVMIGHGGYEADGSMLNAQDISVTSGTGDLADADGNSLTGGITFISGDQDRNFAQIGHGGHNNGANDADGFSGNISVISNGGGVVFDGSIEGGTRYQRTNNGISLDGSSNAARTVTARETGIESYIQIGHGGYAARGDHSGTISIVSQGGVDLIGSVNNSTNQFSFSSATDNLSALSNGVQAANSSNDVWISLSPIKDTAATAGTAFGVSIGAVNVKAGSLRILLSDGTIITDLPDADNDGRQSNIVDQLGNDIGDINYEQGIVKFNSALIGSGSATVVSVDYTSIEGYKERAYAQIGNGGYEADGPNNNAADQAGNSGLIEILAGGDIRVQAGAFYRNYAQIGHGGHSNKGAHSGDIVIGITPGTAGGKLEVLGGNGGHRHYDYEAYGMVGHGGYDADGNHFGDISITTGENAVDGLGVFFKAGDSKDNFVQLGHGGTNSNSGAGNGADSFGLNGDITVTTTGDISFVAGTMTKNNPLYDEDGRLYSMVGHGGYNSDASVNDTNNYGQSDGVAFSRASVGNTNAGVAGVGEGKWGHFGDIVLTSSSGNVNVMAGNTRALADRLDSEGNALPLPSDPLGLLVSNGNSGGIVHYAQIGHGGYATGGDHHGNIVVTASNGSVHLVGGQDTSDSNASKYNYAMIGHGGGNDQGHMGRSDEAIVVQALGANGNVLLAGGTGRYSQAMIGHGGHNVDGTHISNIQVYAGNDVILQGGMAVARVVNRSGEYQGISGADGGNANDLSEFDAHYGANGLGYLMLDQAAAAGGNQKAKLIGNNIQPGTVQFRFAVVDGGGQNAFDSSANPDFVDDGSGNIVAFGGGAPVGSIDYATGEFVWFSAILGADTPDQPDVFVSYDHKTEIINDALRSFAQIGHGGYESRSVSGDHAEGPAVNVGHTGNIDVRAGVDAAGDFNGGGGSLVARAGNDARTYVHIGHGGDDSTAADGHAYRGNITAKADGATVFRGGGGLVDNQNIAFNFGGDGNVESVTEGRSNSGISDVLWAFAQIGHGGYNSEANNGLDNNTNDPLATPSDTTGHNGSVFVQTNSGNVDFAGGGGTGYGHFAQIGHGGHNTNGNHFGNVTVDSGADILFTGGGSSYRSSTVEKRSYAQIGHGGHGMTGNLLGDIDVDALGFISFSGGNVASDFSAVPYGAHVYVLNRAGNQDENHSNRTEARQNHAQIGHGGTLVYGDKQGAIFVDAGTGIDFNGGLRLTERDDSANANFAMIGHGGFFSWRQYNDTTNPAGAINADNYNLFSNLDGTGLPFWPIDNAGNYLPDGFEGNIHVGSSSGDITFTAGNANSTFAMIGHGGYQSGGDHKGTIEVEATNGSILFNADVDNGSDAPAQSGAGNQTFVQIGHGGFYSDGEIGAGTVDGILYSTAISVLAANSIQFDAGDQNSYAMIGHGGISNHGTTVVTTTTPDYRTGNNYGYRPASRSGDISVLSGGNIQFTGGNTDGDYGFVKIGHGGEQIDANPFASSAYGDGHSGAIQVSSTTGSITFQGGERYQDYAQIGHGGTDSFGNHGGDGTDNRLDSDIVVEAATGISFMATGRSNSADAYNFAMIGHGGKRSSFRDNQDVDANFYAILQPYNVYGSNIDDSGAHPWTPYTTNPDGLAILLGTGTLVGTPGETGAGLASLGTFAGDITVRTTGDGADIHFVGPNETLGTTGGNSSYSFVQIGHGGFRNFADIDGNIVVESKGGILFQAVEGNGARGENKQGNYALLGHGGYESGGEFNGSITVTSEDTIRFEGGDSTDGANGSFAQLGHGGYNSDDDHGQYRDAARDATGAQPPLVIDAGNEGDIFVTVNQGDLIFQAGRDAQTHAQLGHGGYSTRDSHTGNITVNVKGGILFQGSQDELATSGNNVGFNNDSFALLGHGGQDSDGSHTGNISVQSGTFTSGTETGGGIVLRSGDYNNNFAQIGHGGNETQGSNTGNITLESSGNLVLGTASGGDRAYAQVGHGGTNADGSMTGDICVHVDGVVSIDASTAATQNAYAHLGHGGFNLTGNHTGFITVLAGGSIDLLGGAALNTHAHLGHGGATGSNGDASGSISIVSGGDIRLIGGTLPESGAMIGHGTSQANTSGTKTGGLNIRAAGNITSTDGTGLAQIAHQSSTGAASVSYSGAGRQAAGDSGFSLVAGNSISLSASQINGSGVVLSFQETLIDALADGDALIGTGSDLSLSSLFSDPLIFDTNHTFSLVSGGTLTVDRSLQNQGGGDIVLLAGWDSSSNLFGITMNGTVDGIPPLGLICLPEFAKAITLPVSCDNYGLNSSRVIIGGGSQVNGVSVGSKGGTTTVLGSGLEVIGSDTNSTGFAQLGVYGDGDGSTAGDIDIYTHGDGIELTAGSQSGAFAQIGHGGAGSRDTPVTGNINVSFCETADISLMGGGTNSYSQLGHGGLDADSNFSGTINLGPNVGSLSIRGGNESQSYSQIGLGGALSNGSKTGDLSIHAESFLIEGGLGANSTARIGHGGNSGTGAIFGDVLVDSSVGAITLMGGGGNSSTAQIGHGGTSYSHSDSRSSHITVTSATGLSLTSGNGNSARSLVGHGGQGSAGIYNGDITVSALDGDIEVRAIGTGTTASAQIGHSAPSNTGAILQGDILVDASNQVEIIGGSTAISFAQIGHGGAGAKGVFSGNTKVNAGNSVLLSIQPDADGAYAKVGHGDDLAPIFSGSGSRSGDIQLGAQNQIGIHGGMVGHVNAATALAKQATATSGNTYIAPSRSNPASGSGALVANSGAEFSSAPNGELRFYFPGKANNQIAAGTLLNSTTYIGTSPIPSASIRGDEFVNIVTGFNAGTPSQHQNLTPFYADNLASGTNLANDSPGAYSIALGNYSLYYNRIALDQNAGGAGTGNGNGGTLSFETVEEFIDYITMGLLEEDGFEYRKRKYARRSHPFFVSYRGYSLYGADGQVSFQFGFQSTDVSEPFISFNSEVAIDLPPASAPQASVNQP